MIAGCPTRVAAVVIGRNEGARLPRCLGSVLAQCAPVVYVDSASTDGSAAAARALGADVVALDLSIPFTFGRARNAGAARALELVPDLDWIQFVDADSEVVASWLDAAVAALAAAPRLGAVHGRVRERRPGDSVYDHLYALEFDPRTEAPDVFGGMAMVRAAAFRDMGGYVETLQSFEDHELSFRLRRAGWQIVCLGSDMVMHEGGMTAWREWWARERRAGHARAQLVALHGRSGAPEWRRAVASIGGWAVLIPALTVAAVWAWGWVGLLVGLAYWALFSRVFRRLHGQGFRPTDAALYAAGRVVGKFPQLHGVLSFLRQATVDCLDRLYSADLVPLGGRRSRGAVWHIETRLGRSRALPSETIDRLPGREGGVRIAYVVNEYPKITHTFVRTEIAAVEQAGVQVDRVAIRRAAAPLLDAADRDEAGRTRVVLDGGVGGLLAALVRTAVQRPCAFARALRQAARIGWRSERGLARHLAYLAEACVLLQWTGAWRTDHVHAAFGSNPAAVALLCRALGGPPYSFTAHGPEELERAPLLAIPEKVEKAAFVAVISEAGRVHLQQWCRPEVWGRIHVVRCGIDGRFSQSAPTPVPAARRVVFVGRLTPEKAPLLLLDAVAQLNAAGAVCDLVMVGDGPLRARVEARIQALGLSARVTLVGWAGADDVRRHILGARALVLPSFAEGLPVVLMEALALHRPVICTAVGGVAELVESGVCGWVIAPGSIEALAAAIAKALDAAPAELLQMGDEGAARVARLHDGAAAGRALAALFTAAGRQSAGRARAEQGLSKG